MSLNLPWLDDRCSRFPETATALKHPNGLLVAGGTLDTDTLTRAYRRGIFPWYEAGQPVLWWSPDPRMVLFPAELHISKSMRGFLGKHEYTITINRDFEAVVSNCAGSRPGSQGTWITPQVKAAYCNMHKTGLAHSVEVWAGNDLVGGLYGIAMDRIFFGESMFSHRDNTSKLALIHLVAELVSVGVGLIDCQVPNPHLESLGARLIPREKFENYLPKQDKSPLNGTRQLFLPPGWP